MISKLYWFNLLTNMHVGGLGDSFSIVDKQIQRDPVSQNPVVFASSQKGALRSYANSKLSADFTADDVNNIFGKDIDEQKTTAQGHVRFTDARLLFYPLRTNRCSYMLATCPAMLEEYVDFLTAVGLGDSATVASCKALLAATNEQNAEGQSIFRKPTANNPVLLLGKQVDTPSGLRAESLAVTRGQLPEGVDLATILPGEVRFLFVSDEAMSMLLESLPVLAHNKLENGLSKTLWYEEVVPRKCIFYTVMLSDDANAMAKLNACLSNALVQLGANATLGYGLCKVTERT